MRVIKEADQNISKLWGAGKIGSEEYRLLTYVLSTDVDEGTLIHNCVTGELLFLEKNEAARLSLLPCTYAPWMDELIRKHFLVKKDAEDQKNVETLRTALYILGTRKEITKYTILPTTHCNARCFYCFEAGTHYTTMNNETIDQLVAFIDANRGENPISIRWFGGEPLVGIKQIDHIVGALREKNISFSSTMVSNGSLFTEAIAKRAKEEWLLKEIQITLDGTEKVYNETKAYLNATGSPYQKVLNNIEYLLNQDIEVCIRMNLGLHNSDDLTALTYELSKRFYARDNLFVYASLLFGNCGYEPTHLEQDELQFLTQKKEELDSYIKQCSLSPARGVMPKLKYNRCMADNPSAVVVLPSGMLGKCEHYTETHLVGDLKSGLTNKAEINHFKEKVDFPICAQCAQYPSCIKIDLCDADRVCNEMLIKTKEHEIIQSMRYTYGGYVKKQS